MPSSEAGGRNLSPVLDHRNPIDLVRSGPLDPVLPLYQSQILALDPLPSEQFLRFLECRSEFLDAPGEHLNSETALVFENRDLSTTLAALIYERDLAYCRLITPEMAATFKDSDEACTRLRKILGDFFEKQM